jgi:hypothetical protein
VAGAVAGNLHGSELVVLEAGARVVGDVSAPSIGIRPGALLRGRVETGAGGAPRPRAKTTKQAAATPLSAPLRADPRKVSTAKKAAAAKSARKAPAPVMPKANGPAAKKSAKQAPAKSAGKAKKSARQAPAPTVPTLGRVPALGRRTKKASKRRSR